MSIPWCKKCREMEESKKIVLQNKISKQPPKMHNKKLKKSKFKRKKPLKNRNQGHTLVKKM